MNKNHQPQDDRDIELQNMIEAQTIDDSHNGHDWSSHQESRETPGVSRKLRNIILGTVAVVGGGGIYALSGFSESSPSPEPAVTHTVEDGETVQSILQDTCDGNLTAAELKAAQQGVALDNSLTSPDNPQIHAGQEIVIKCP